MPPNRGYHEDATPIVLGERMSKKQSEHSFSVELGSRSHLRTLSLCGDDKATLVEGALGRLIEVNLRDDIVLELQGENGVLRLDIDRKELEGCLARRAK